MYIYIHGGLAYPNMYISECTCGRGRFASWPLWPPACVGAGPARSRYM